MTVQTPFARSWKYKSHYLLGVFVLDKLGVLKLGDKLDFLLLAFVAMWTSSLPKGEDDSEEDRAECQSETKGLIQQNKGNTIQNKSRQGRDAN